MKIKNKELNAAYSTLATISIPSTISLDSITNLIRLTSKTKELLEEFTKTLTALMTSYSVKEEEGAYNWEKHDKKEEITKKYNDLLDKFVKIEGITLDEDNLLAKLSVGKPIGVILSLQNLLNS